MYTVENSHIPSDFPYPEKTITYFHDFHFTERSVQFTFTKETFYKTERETPNYSNGIGAYFRLKELKPKP